MMSRGRRAVSVSAALALLASVFAVGSAATVGAASLTHGVQVQPFVTGLPDVPPGNPFSDVGPYGLTFDRTDHLIVSDVEDGGLYSFGPAGSSAPVPMSTGNVQTGLAFAKNGDLFANLYQVGNIDQIDPTSGAFIRQLNPPGSTHQCAASLATDPVTGDLFFGQPNSGGVCPGTFGITRIEHPTSADPTFVTVNPAPNSNYIGLTFARDGTLYAVQQSSDGGCAVRITGITSPRAPIVTELACFPNFQDEFIGIEAIALSARSAGAPTLFVAGPSGTITEIDQTTPPTVTPIATLATRVDNLVVGTDGCLYATQSTGIDRIVPSNGPCHLVPVNVLPTLRLRPDTTGTTGTTGAAITGHAVTLRVKLVGADHESAHRVTFTVVGPNATTRVVRTDGSGRADFTYHGGRTGTDVVTATTTLDGQPLTSNPATVRWQAPVQPHP